MKQMMRNTLLITLLTAAGLTACAPRQSGNSSALHNGRIEEKVSSSQIQAVVNHVGQNVLVATYTDLSDKTLALHKAALALKAQPTQENLEAAQAAWKAARVPWESSESFLFGPVDSLGVDPHIDSWPLSKIDLDRILRDHPTITADFVRSLGTDVQGFHTVEYLLFGEGIERNTKSIREMTSSQISYLVACSEVLHEQTELLKNAWISHHDPELPNSPSYVSVFTAPGASNTFYPSQAAVLQELINGMINIASEVGKAKLSDPLGASAAVADPSLVESQFSWNSLADFQDNIRSIRYLYTGDYRSTNQGPGLDELVKAVSPELDQKILGQIDEGIKLIADIAGTEGLAFSQAIRDEAARARIQAAIDHLAILENTLRTELLPLAQ